MRALAAGVYLATMGRPGLRQVAELCYQQGPLLPAGMIGALPGFTCVHDGPFFNEFVVRCPDRPRR